MKATLEKSYTPATYESAAWAKWNAARAFHADPRRTTEGGQPPYCVLIPPPNVTAALHLGHALNNTLQDILVRYHRMRGFNTLWMPGTDHAGIATQAVVEKRLLQEGKRRTDFTREEFIALVQQWKDEYEATITEQLKAMGCSCDFERQRFTMDDVCATAVREAFFRLFKDGLIYRGKRLVNWDPVTQTALADDEVEMEEVQGFMYFLRYPLVHPSQNPDDPKDCQEVTWNELAARGYPGADARGGEQPAWVTVATTRPETYLGDTAVAVNPKDPRAASLRGLCVQLPLVGRVIPVIEDDYVVRPVEFGGDPADAKAAIATGFLKVTPAHDPNDEQIGLRHNLRVINVLAPDASISDKHGWTDIGDAGLFIGLSREAAREKVVREFEARGLLEAKKPYTHSVGHSYRSHVPIEPYLSDQWYVKVTDDRLVGEAQRAVADHQFDGVKPVRSKASRDREGADSEASPDRKEAVAGRAEPHCFLITFTTYGSWLHGDTRGSVDRKHNAPGTEVLVGDETRERMEFERLRQAPMKLSVEERRVVQQAIADVCRHRGWRLIALNVRSNHVHVVVVMDGTPERAMIEFKAYATRRLREAGLIEGDRRVWTRHGSTRHINTDATYQRAVEYVLHEQGEVLDPPPIDGTEPLPHGRGSLRIARSPDPGGRADVETPKVDRTDRSLTVAAHSHHYDGDLTFFPARYARTYQQWHAGLRDWCISRQLWWGHRIPVWRKTVDRQYNRAHASGGEWDSWTEDYAQEGLRADLAGRITFQVNLHADGTSDRFVCVAPGNQEIERELESCGFTQDPDVLDTWFSSGLWPLSTMGWPEPDAWPKDIPEGSALLDAFNPSSVLCTAREIITLWVSRMVMFNRYLTADDPDPSRQSRLPFRHVYIHPMIQDGHGQKMSKSLGNGVDPRDIIHSHGADALRFTLAQLATATQDVRMGVDTVCPHEGCGETFQPREITTSAGHVVAAPEQTCPKCKRGMVTVYGAVSGAAKPTADKPLARNSSSRFDLGRNFANKLWNAVRFALSSLEPSPAERGPGEGSTSVAAGSPSPPAPHPQGERSLALADRWIISRLHRTLHKVEDGLAEYQFNTYAEAMYDLVRRDFCDWYLEAIKPTVRTSPAQQQVLRTVLNAIMRLLHPIMPFITETLWPHVRATGAAGLPGVVLEESDLLATAPWPDVACSVEDDEAVTLFERLRGLVEAIRTLRGEHKVHDRKRISLYVSDSIHALIEQGGEMVSTLAGIETIRPLKDKPADAVPLVYEGADLALAGLADEVDRAAHRVRLQQEIEALVKRIAGHEGRLSNEGYLNKAPAEKVRQTRDELGLFREELARKQDALKSLADGG